MSLYNLLFGEHSYAPILLKCLGVDENQVPRYRSCYIDEGRICIHTRTGGGNRDFYENEKTNREYFPESDYTGPFNEDLRKIPGFIEDKDDDFDSTYASFYFNFPDTFKAELEALDKEVEHVSPSEQWKALFETLERKP